MNEADWMYRTSDNGQKPLISAIFEGLEGWNLANMAKKGKNFVSFDEVNVFCKFHEIWGK